MRTIPSDARRTNQGTDGRLQNSQTITWARNCYPEQLPPKPRRDCFAKCRTWFFRKQTNFHEDGEISFPEYLLIPKSNQSTFEKTQILQLVGEPKTANTVSEFLSQQLGMKKVGNFVYSIGTLDYIAASFMKAEYSSWKQKN